MSQLHETLMGRKLIEGTLPRIADALEEIARQLKIANNKEAYLEEAYWEDMEKKLSEQDPPSTLPF